jgi:hypothetical protein
MGRPCSIHKGNEKYKGISKRSRISSVALHIRQHRVALAAIVTFNLDKAVCQETSLCQHWELLYWCFCDHVCVCVCVW